MRKISELTTDNAVDIICEIIPYVEDIITDEELMAEIKSKLNLSQGANKLELYALLVGKITNAHKDVCRVTRGEEKGYFEFGGSTIILLLEQDKVNVSADLFENTKEDFETKVKQGEALGEANV